MSHGGRPAFSAEALSCAIGASCRSLRLRARAFSGTASAEAAGVEPPEGAPLRGPASQSWRPGSCLATKPARCGQPERGSPASRAGGAAAPAPLPLSERRLAQHLALPPSQDPFLDSVLANENPYLEKMRASKKSPYKNPTHLSQQQEPWSRLSAAHTITSMKRDIDFFDPKIPKDDLDFRLTTLYNHHTETFKDKCEILVHQETVRDNHGMNAAELSPSPLLPPVTSLANIRHWISPKKESIHSIQGSIVSPHTAATNGGYSRKNDGGFFST